MSLNRQLLNHKVTFLSFIQLLGSQASAAKYLNNCLYYVGIGSNDYLNNYFMRENYTTSSLYTPDRYAKALIDQYGQQLRILYHLGARKIALVGLGAIGNIPYVFSTQCPNNLSCVADINNAAALFDARLVSLVDQLNRDFPNAHITYLNTSSITSGDPSLAGFRVVTVECCPVRSDGPCVPNSIPCQNRTEYVFWDAFHPTEALNQISARSYAAFLPSDAHPYDISHLV